MAHGVGSGNSFPTCPTTIRQHPLPNEIFFHHLFLNALRRVNTTRIMCGLSVRPRECGSDWI